MWEFFRIVIPVGLTIIGIFLATQTFAKSMNYDNNIVGESTIYFGKEIYNIGVYIMAVIKYLPYAQFAPYILDSLKPIYICLFSGLGFILFWGIIRISNSNKRNMHGTARWATKKDLKNKGLLYKDGGVVLAQLNTAKVIPDESNTALKLTLKKQAQFIAHSGKANTLLLAPTGSGKGVGVIIPTLLSYKGSMVIYDPKGENYSFTAGYRSTFSTVIRFAPMSHLTARFNPMSCIRDDDDFAVSDTDLLTSIIFAPAKGGGDETSEFFSTTARNMVRTVILHLRFGEGIKDEDRCLSGVKSYLNSTEFDIPPNLLQKGECPGDGKWKNIIKSKHYFKKKNESGKTVKVLASNLHKIIVEGANQAKSQNEKSKGDTYQTVFTKLDLFTDPLVANATRGNDFDIADFYDSEKPISLYLVVPTSDDERLAPVMKLLITFMLKTFSKGETQHGAVQLANHLLFLLDEFPLLGSIPIISRSMGILRGYGVNFLIVCQALNQLIDVYGQNHPFRDHAVRQVIYAPGSYKDAEEISNSIGNETFKEVKISSSGSRFVTTNNHNFSDNTSGRRLIEAAEIMRLPGDKCFVLAHGMQPYIATKCVYYEDKRFKEKLKYKAPQNMKELRKQLRKLPSVKKRLELEKRTKEKKLSNVNITLAEKETLKQVKINEKHEAFQGFFDEDMGLIVEAAHRLQEEQN